jgi:hypothetical protein
MQLNKIKIVKRVVIRGNKLLSLKNQGIIDIMFGLVSRE